MPVERGGRGLRLRRACAWVLPALLLPLWPRAVGQAVPGETVEQLRREIARERLEDQLAESPDESARFRQVARGPSTWGEADGAFLRIEQPLEGVSALVSLNPRPAGPPPVRVLLHHQREQWLALEPGTYRAEVLLRRRGADDTLRLPGREIRLRGGMAYELALEPALARRLAPAPPSP